MSDDDRFSDEIATEVGSGPDTFFLVASKGTPYVGSPNFFRTEIPNDASGFTLAVAAVDLTFQLLLEGMLGTGDWPSADAFLEAIRSEDGPAPTLEEGWSATDKAALSYLGQIDINPPILRKLLLTAGRRGLFERYFSVRPHPDLETSYAYYVRSANEVPESAVGDQ